VSESKKDVFVLFHAPWAQRSLSLIEEFNQVAAELKNVPNLLFAQMDVTVNQAKGLSFDDEAPLPVLRLY